MTPRPEASEALDLRAGGAIGKHEAAPAPSGSCHPIQRTLMLLVTALSLALAVVGLLVPGLPSTEFLLVAAWAAARSSPRLHRWLVTHRWFGPPLQNWRNGRLVSRRSKLWCTFSMALSAWLMASTVPHLPSVLITIACMLCVLVWIWRRQEPSA